MKKDGWLAKQNAGLERAFRVVLPSSVPGRAPPGLREKGFGPHDPATGTG
ncbi:MAG: hypothetical protein WBD78_14025 [Methylocella sp.]